MEVSFWSHQPLTPQSLTQIESVVHRMMENLDLVHDLSPESELSVSLVEASSIAEMNERFLQHEGPTDVLTFDLRDGTPPHQDLGEIIICTDVAAENAHEYKTSLSRELTLYLVHGLLHLAGHDDHHEPAITKMRQAEQDALALLADRFDLDRLFAFSGGLSSTAV